ncbi:MAG TPA: amidohydrolase family protein [Phenylobacterium sp.]|uniref:N-acyl-D-amino-acid deacylase family protein n=1 Tax=Phenylobacterium sp. TaxID=1871053 RepID=UPI002B494562|nr:amidohydrolase family protein [Phenylobacterium sp.]HKR90278.1 amidohydrolase family protein [Phenylobacterium sp.]
MTVSAPQFDIVIRGGVVIDGTGAAGFAADVAVKDGTIAAVGEIEGRGREEIDAAGRLVTPGFIDIHSHYDGQVTWEPRLQPSSYHGVTTVLMGNCGVGFAPCRPQDRDLLMRLMEGVEDIPQVVMSEGLPWNWESFPEYLDSLEGRRFDMDVCAQLPHAALRVYVMGERGARGEPATPDDVARMRALAAEAIGAGAFGFTTSQSITHRTKSGEPIPTRNATSEELVGIALGLKDAGGGLLEYVGALDAPAMRMLWAMMEASGRPLSFSLVQAPANRDTWRDSLADLERAKAAGHQMRAQVCGRPVGIFLGLELTMNPFSLHRAYRAIQDLPLAERVSRLSDPVFRRPLLADEPGTDEVFDRASLLDFNNMFPVAPIPDYEPRDEDSIAALARRRRVSPQEAALDHMLSDGGRGLIYVPFLNYFDRDLEAAREMLEHPLCLPGLGDGGAHVGLISDGSLTTSNLTLWTRDRVRGPKLDIAQIIRLQTSECARWIGLGDRGRVAAGLRADLNVIDYDGLTLRAPEVRNDLPGGGRRLVQRADGYVLTMVAGQVTYRHGQPTQSLPGRLVRSPAAKGFREGARQCLH